MRDKLIFLQKVSHSLPLFVAQYVTGEKMQNTFAPTEDRAQAARLEIGHSTT